ncbi:MAG: aconitase X swivel domain-containing protein [Blastocatellia bacterium]
MAKIIEGKTLVAGAAKGLALTTNEPLSFWGGYDQWTGEIIDRRHPLSGENAKDKVLVVPASRGSSTTTAVLLEAIRNGNAPAAIVVSCVDRFFALASIVADEMYGRPIPVVALSDEDFASLKTGEQIEIFTDGKLTIG